MGKKSKPKKGFNTPFSKVTLPEPAPDASPPTPEPKADDGRTDGEIFESAMRGIKRIDPGSGRIAPAKRSSSAIPTDDDDVVMELTALVDGDGPFRFFATEEVHTGAAPGVSFELLDRLRNGSFAYRRHVDLHGLSRAEAKPCLIDFVKEARRDGERCVLVVTGRGRGSPGGVSVLREALPRWLSRSPLRSHVLAFCTARQVDGGPGAYYVLLRRAGVRPYGDLA